jgi:hypothetical protein
MPLPTRASLREVLALCEPDPSATCVDLVSHRFQMKRVYAEGVFARVINDQGVWDGAVRLDKDPSMPQPVLPASGDVSVPTAPTPAD